MYGIVAGLVTYAIILGIRFIGDGNFSHSLQKGAWIHEHGNLLFKCNPGLMCSISFGLSPNPDGATIRPH